MTSLLSFKAYSQDKRIDIPPMYKNGRGFTDIMFGDGKLATAKEDNFYVINYRFKISANGIIDSIITNGSEDIELRNYFKSKIKETEKYWKPRTVNGIPTDSKWFSWTIYFGAKRFADTEAEEMKLLTGYPILESAYKIELNQFEIESKKNKFIYWETDNMYMLKPWLLLGAIR